MPTHHRTFLLCAALASLLAHDAAALSHTGELELSIELTVNPVEGSPTSCRASAKVATLRQEWWAAFGDANRHLAEGWEAVDSKPKCGAGSAKNEPQRRDATDGSDYMKARIETVAGFLPPLLTPERILVLNVSIVMQTLSGFGASGDPIYHESSVKRDFFFLEGGDAFIPLLVANDTERVAFGVHEILLEIAAGRARDESAAAYGAVLVTSGTENGEVLLDGGVVGPITAGSETVLGNVPVGVREVKVRLASGRETRKVVDVPTNGTVVVDPSPSKPERNALAYRLTPLGKNANGYEEYRRERDGQVVVRIPAGEFLMGNHETEGTPFEHLVYVSEFLIDKTGVTWGQYRRFAEATGAPMPRREPYWGIHDDHPVVFVLWEEGKSYCEWAGGRLPTEAEREKAARGTDGRKYPWGNEEPDHDRAVFRSSWGNEATAAVGTHPAGASPYGVQDMGGNVWEWCSDWFDADYFKVSPYRDPQGPLSGTAHVMKGASWDSRPSLLSASCRNFAQRGYFEGDFGFRCAMKAPQ